MTKDSAGRGCSLPCSGGIKSSLLKKTEAPEMFSHCALQGVKG